MNRITFVLSLFAALGLAVPIEAQGRGPKQARGGGGVPPGHLPPAGMCRIWIDGTPPGLQPPATSCAEAYRRVPTNGRVIHGDAAAFPGQGKGRWEHASRGRSEDCREREDGEYDRRAPRQPRRSGGDICIDRDRDGRCDVVTTRRSDVCVDRDSDGRCDDVQRSTSTDRSIEEMIEIMRRRGAPLPRQ